MHDWLVSWQLSEEAISSAFTRAAKIVSDGSIAAGEYVLYVLRSRRLHRTLYLPSCSWFACSHVRASWLCAESRYRSLKTRTRPMSGATTSLIKKERWPPHDKREERERVAAGIAATRFVEFPGDADTHSSEEKRASGLRSNWGQRGGRAESLTADFARFMRRNRAPPKLPNRESHRWQMAMNDRILRLTREALDK